jgi:hypothetical protein
VSNLEQPENIQNDVAAPQQRKRAGGLASIPQTITGLFTGSDPQNVYGGGEFTQQQSTAESTAERRKMHGKTNAREEHGKNKRSSYYSNYSQDGSSNPKNAHGNTPGAGDQEPQLAEEQDSSSFPPPPPPSGADNPKNAHGKVPGPGGPNPQSNKRGTLDLVRKKTVGLIWSV